MDPLLFKHKNFISESMEPTHFPNAEMAAGDCPPIIADIQRLFRKDTSHNNTKQYSDKIMIRGNGKGEISYSVASAHVWLRVQRAVSRVTS